MMRSGRRGIILPIVLIVIALLSVTMAGFLFFVRAETAGTKAHANAQQARLAAESGFEVVLATIRQDPHNVKAWFDNPSLFRHMLVWSEAYERENDPVRRTGVRRVLREQFGTPPEAWRFSVVADKYVEPTGFENRAMRFGITPEAGKLNLNTATEQQIRDLLQPILVALNVEAPEQLIASLLDWRDSDSDTRDGGAENPYYNTLKPPYNAKNGPFDTVEELLLVKGFNAAILYGEDTNLNGILDENENDGELSFPYYDNANGELERGIYPYLTIWSHEPDTALDNKPRINLNQDAGTIQAQVQTSFTEDELSKCQGAIDFILQLKSQGFAFNQLASPAELYPAEETAPTSEPTSQPSSQPAGRGGQDRRLAASPVTLEQLPYIMDRFSTLQVQQQGQQIAGLININTAPLRVIQLIPGMTTDGAKLIVELRTQLDATALRTTAWPLVAGAVDAATFHAIAPYITTKAYQFHVEVIGYADHCPLMQRYEWIIDMIGPLAQVRYERDLSGLGQAWPIDDEDVVGVGTDLGSSGP